MLLLELGLDFDWIDTATDEGQSQLREFSPLWKVPAIEIAGRAVYDSDVIARQLIELYGYGPLAALREGDENIVTVVDGALDSLINAFYLAKDGVDERSSYLIKQRKRAASALEWVEQRLGEPSLCRGLSWPGIALATTLAWTEFRGTFPLNEHPPLRDWLAGWQGRASFSSTAPPAG